MTINLSIKEHGAYKKVSVTAFLPFEMYGYEFAAHKAYTGNAVNLNYQWNVSELSTGFRVEGNCFTRKQALERAKTRLEAIGKDKVIEAIEYAKTL